MTSFTYKFCFFKATINPTFVSFSRKNCIHLLCILQAGVVIESPRNKIYTYVSKKENL
jgi:hypothetical protein